jgi:hypothetical protein
MAKTKREKHDAKDIERVRKMRLDGLTLREIAEKTGINQGTVGGMLYRKYGDFPAKVKYPGRAKVEKKPRARKPRKKAADAPPAPSA